ncbi:MAG TPA: ferritin family protein [Burkholderiales bacterium]|jgi:rubrerythrin
MTPIRTAPELYAHAIAIEREAAERYAEFAERMNDLGNVALAELFGRLAEIEAEHLDSLLRRTRGVALPHPSTTAYQWLDAAAPETAARELVFRLMTPRHALEIALAGEKRAQAFFERVLITADDPALRALAREMAAEEQEHVRLVERLLERTPDPNVDWEEVFEGKRAAQQKGAIDV